MQTPFQEETNKIWKRLTKSDKIRDFNFEPNVYKHLLDFFMAGDYYYYIVNLQEMTFELMSPEAESILGFPVQQINVPMFLGLIHPEDQPWFLNFENKVVEFFSRLGKEQIPNYKVRYDYRIRRADGSYIRILQQVISIQYEDNRVARTFGVHTDISHLKMNGTPVLSLIGMNGEPSYHNVRVENKFSSNATGLTQRETEILKLLAAGKSSAEISELCFISLHTVNTHRRNLLGKTKCSNTADLISHALKKGWI